MDVGAENIADYLKLKVNNDKTQSGQWVAFSHCWGKPTKHTRFLLTTENEARLKAKLTFEQLPASIQDAIVVTRKLRIRYLWIDTLCIQQDSEDDWAREAAQMGRYYHQSILTLVARDTASDEDGFLMDRELRTDRATEVEVGFPGGNRPSEGVLFLSMPQMCREEVPETEQFVHTRAWTLQETTLAIRILEFTARQIRWSCSSASAEESGHMAGMIETDWFVARRALNARSLTSEDHTSKRGRLLSKTARAVTRRTAGTWMGQILSRTLADTSFRSQNLDTWYVMVI